MEACIEVFSSLAVLNFPFTHPNMLLFLAQKAVCLLQFFCLLVFLVSVNIDKLFKN